jgi:hypothetical protein
MVLGVLTLLMIAGAVPVKDGSQTAIFQTPVFLLAAAALAVSLIVCSVRRLHWRNIPFLLCHLGAVLILAGALTRFVWGEKYEVTIPVARSHRALNLRMPDGTPRPLGFGLSVTEFSVGFYNPVYRLMAGDKVLGEFTAGNGSFLDLGERGRIAVAELKLPGVHGWKPQYMLPNGLRLECSALTPKHYEARLEFALPDNSAEQAVLAVNRPVFHGGWWFHLQSYDAHAGRYVIVGIKRDPGLRAALGGIWMVMAGTAGLCFRKQRAES